MPLRCGSLTTDPPVDEVVSSMGLRPCCDVRCGLFYSDPGVVRQLLIWLDLSGVNARNFQNAWMQTFGLRHSATLEMDVASLSCQELYFLVCPAT